MNFWTCVTDGKPDVELHVLVCTTNDEKFMAAWDGEVWLDADSELPVSGTVWSWVLLEDVPSSAELAAEEGRHQREVGRLEDEVAGLESYDPCVDCSARKYSTTTHCSGCGDLKVAEASVVKQANGKWLCPECAATELNKGLAAHSLRGGKTKGE